ncbi:hypothetical protein [Clostridium estertheticum]|nr:hypothetical protein [Clostridium estertheticum]MBU3174697.1 hypothetical protein [Clostridium estertheticum]
MKIGKEVEYGAKIKIKAKMRRNSCVSLLLCNYIQTIVFTNMELKTQKVY